MIPKVTVLLCIIMLPKNNQYSFIFSLFISDNINTFIFIYLNGYLTRCLLDEDILFNNILNSCLLFCVTRLTYLYLFNFSFLSYDLTTKNICFFHDNIYVGMYTITERFENFVSGIVLLLMKVSAIQN